MAGARRGIGSESRELTYVWVTQIPVDGKPENVYNIVTSYKTSGYRKQNFLNYYSM